MSPSKSPMECILHGMLENANARVNRYHVRDLLTSLRAEDTRENVARTIYETDDRASAWSDWEELAKDDPTRIRTLERATLVLSIVSLAGEP